MNGPDEVTEPLKRSLMPGVAMAYKVSEGISRRGTDSYQIRQVTDDIARYNDQIRDNSFTPQGVAERMVWAERFASQSFLELQNVILQRDIEATQRSVESIDDRWKDAPVEQKFWARETVRDYRGAHLSTVEAEAESRQSRQDLSRSGQFRIEASQAERSGDFTASRDLKSLAERLYDSSERRGSLAESLKSEGAEQEIIDARVISDTMQSRPGRQFSARARTARTPRVFPRRQWRGRTIPRGKNFGR